MNLTEGFLRDELYIDFGSEILYSCDQMYLDYPCRFATVTFQLMNTAGLSRIADRIRKDDGFRPMHPMDEYSDEFCDQNGWYEMSISLNEWDKQKIDTFIEVVVENSDSPDNGELYTIDLNQDEQIEVYNRLDEQCRENLGKSCADLLAESREQLEKEMEDGT